MTNTHISIDHNIMSNIDNIVHPMLNNKCARIWAFDEMIDNNTYNDSHTKQEGITEIINIFNIIINTKNLNIDYKIINECHLVFSRELFIFNGNINDNDKIRNISINESIYYLCGWLKHAIIIFVTKITSDKYDLGIINCGKGIEFQGYNNDKCNGIIIFKNINYDTICNFLQNYKTYYINIYKKTDKRESFESNQVYKSFYLLLFHKILNENNENEVDFLKLQKENKAIFYELPKQNIGSCLFTNTINILYYIFIKKNPGKSPQEIYTLYLTLYNSIKHFIINKIYNDIKTCNDSKTCENTWSQKNFEYYNIHKYIIDTDQENKFAPPLYNMINIEPNIYKYTVIDLKKPILYIDRDNDKNNFWGLYDNKIRFSDIYNTHKNTVYYTDGTLLIKMFMFFKNVSSFDNNMKLLIPLLILYNFKKTYTLDEDNTPDSSFWSIFKNLVLPTIFVDIHDSTEYIIYICIVILLLKDTGTLSEDNIYYTSIENMNPSSQKENFDYYNFKVFQYIPIINNYYLNIIKILINDLYDNIGILPNIENSDHIKITCDNAFIELTNNNCKYFIIYLKQVYTKQPRIRLCDYSCKYNFLLSYIFVHTVYDTLPNFELCNFEVYGLKKSDKYTNTIVPSKMFTIDKNNIYDPETNILYCQIIKICCNYIDTKLTDYDITTLFLLPEILKLYIIRFYLYYLQKTDEQNIIDMNKKYFDKFNSHASAYFKDIYHGQFKTIINIYNYIYKLNFSTEKNTFIIDEKTLISNIEKKYFTVKEYEYYDSDDENLCSSVIEFYSIYTTEYNLVFPKNEQNLPESIIIIKELLKWDISISIYLLLNFSFIKKDNIIIGICKYNNINSLEFNIKTFNLIYIENTERYIYIDDIQSIHIPAYINFYNLMSYNDNGLFLYKKENANIYYLRSFRYDFLFIMKKGNIYICIDTNEYIVKWYNDEDNYNIYGILKLYKINKNDENDEIVETVDSKIICIYNYNIIIKSINNNNQYIIKECKKYIDNTFKSSITDTFNNLKELPDEYKVYYFTVLNKYNDKYILTNISDVLALLINCLYYNSPFLILKNIEQIKIILNNNNHDKTNLDKLLNTLFLNFDNIYSLPILFLFNKKVLNSFFYNSSTILRQLYIIFMRYY